MKRGYSTPILTPTYPEPPYHYVDARIFLALFNPPEDAVKDLLPEPLRPSQLPLAGLLFGEQPCKEAGSFMEAGLLVQCLFDNPETGEEEVGVHFAYNYVDTDVALAAGREIWGYPRKMADISLEMKGDTITGSAVRDGTTLLRATCRLEDEGEWIDSGPNVNVKLVPSVTGKGYDLSVITAAYLEYTIKNGRSGEVEIEFQSGPRDDLSKVKMETPMIGLYFDCDILVPPGKVVAELKS
ncbi:MAG: acetoacetate decarboxylase family protein [Candidatus Thorarchaeota archaeon]